MAPYWQGHHRIIAPWAHLALFVWGMSPDCLNIPKASSASAQGFPKRPNIRVLTCTGQASSHTSPPQQPTNGFVHHAVIRPNALSSSRRSYKILQTGLELALNARQSLNSLSSYCFLQRTECPQVQQQMPFQVIKWIPSRSTACDRLGCFLHMTNFNAGDPPGQFNQGKTRLILKKSVNNLNKTSMSNAYDFFKKNLKFHLLLTIT